MYLYRLESAFAGREHCDFHVIDRKSTQKKNRKEKEERSPGKVYDLRKLNNNAAAYRMYVFSEIAMHSGVSAWFAWNARPIGEQYAL